MMMLQAVWDDFAYVYWVNMRNPSSEFQILED